MEVGDIVRVEASEEALLDIGVDLVEVIGKDLKVLKFFMSGFVEVEWEHSTLGTINYDIPKTLLRVVGKESNSVLVDKIVDLIDDDELTLKEFLKIQSAVKSHIFYDNDGEIEFEDVKEYVSWAIDQDEWDCLKEIYGETYSSVFDDIEVKTLDDEQRLQLLSKVYNETSNYPELRMVINSKYGRF